MFGRIFHFLFFCIYMLVHIVYLYTLHVYTLCICMKHGSKIGISGCKLECRIKFD